MVEVKDVEAVTYENSEAGFGSLWIVKGVDCLIYTQRYRHGGRTSITISRIRSSNRYPLTFSTWTLSLNIIPMIYLLVLIHSQQGYFSFEVQSCTFIGQFYIMDISVTLCTCSFLVPSRKQVVDSKESKTILWSPKELRGST